MSVEAAIGTGIGTAIGTSIGPGVGSAIGASFGGSAEIGSMASFGHAISSFTPSIDSGFGTTFSPEVLSGGLHKSIGMAEIMATTVPYEVNIGSLNPDLVIPGEPRMVFDDRLFSTMAMPMMEPSFQEFTLPESLRYRGVETRSVLGHTSAITADEDPVVAETMADQKFSDSLTVEIAQLFQTEPINQTFWTGLVTKALSKADPESAYEEEAMVDQNAKPVIIDIYEPQTDWLGISTEQTPNLAPQVKTETVDKPETVAIAAANYSDESIPPPDKPVEENTKEPEEEKLPENKEPVWNIYDLQETWKTAKESLKRRTELGREIVSRAFSDKEAIPAAQIAAEAALLDIPGVFETKEVLQGKLKLPTVQHEVALNAIATGDSYGKTDVAVQKAIYKKVPTEKDHTQQFLLRTEQSKLVAPARLLAEQGAQVILLRKRKLVWETAKKRVGIHPVEMEKVEKNAA